MLQPMALQDGVNFHSSFNCYDFTQYMTRNELITGATVLAHECNWSQSVQAICDALSKSVWTKLTCIRR